MTDFPHSISINGTIIDRTGLSVIDDPAIRSFLEEWWNSESYVTVNTSGSTGTPKPIRISKQHMINSARMTIDFFQLVPGTKALLCLPAQFIAGKMMLVRAMVGEWELKSIDTSGDPLKTIGTTENYDFCAMIPLQASNSLSDPSTRKKFEQIRKVIIGGGECSASLITQMQSLINECYATYGMTETITHIAVRALNGPKRSDSFTFLKGIRCNLDERGCLTIDAPLLSNETIITNDLVEFTDLNKFKWLGRIDNVINSGGLKLFPEQIEKEIEFIVTDRRFFVGGIPDEQLGNKVILVLEGQPLDKYTENLLLNHLRESLPRNHAPREIRYQSQFSETETGKIRRII